MDVYFISDFTSDESKQAKGATSDERRLSETDIERLLRPILIRNVAAADKANALRAAIKKGIPFSELVRAYFSMSVAVSVSEKLQLEPQFHCVNESQKARLAPLLAREPGAMFPSCCRLLAGQLNRARSLPSSLAVDRNADAMPIDNANANLNSNNINNIVSNNDDDDDNRTYYASNDNDNADNADNGNNTNNPNSNIVDGNN